VFGRTELLKKPGIKEFLKVFEGEVGWKNEEIVEQPKTCSVRLREDQKTNTGPEPQLRPVVGGKSTEKRGGGEGDCWKKGGGRGNEDMKRKNNPHSRKGADQPR